MSGNKPMDGTVKAAWIGLIGVLVAALISGAFVLLDHIWPPPPTPTPGPIIQNSPITTPDPTPSPAWALTITHPNLGQSDPQALLPSFYVDVTAIVVNQASDGDTHAVEASEFHLYPETNDVPDLQTPYKLALPLATTDYQISHNSSNTIWLTFVAPTSQNRFDLVLDGADKSWSFSESAPASL